MATFLDAKILPDTNADPRHSWPESSCQLFFEFAFIISFTTMTAFYESRKTYAPLLDATCICDAGNYCLPTCRPYQRL